MPCANWLLINAQFGYRRTRAAKVQPILDTLAALSLLRWVEAENAYAA